MAHKPRKEMIAETRAKLIAAGRAAFGKVGYADASMDDFTAAAGLTRGALYHHFGDKKGLFEAVVAEIDTEMNERLKRVSENAPDPWQGFADECTVYLEMALEPEIQRIILRDGSAVLGDPYLWPNQNSCITAMTHSLRECLETGMISDVDPEAVARLVNGATIHAAQWIANAEDPRETLKKSVTAFNMMLAGLQTKTA